MSPRNIAIVLFVLFTKSATCGKGYVKEIYMNKKFYCEEASKDVIILNSQIQCIHRCILKNCKLINYITKQDDKANCEMLSKTDDCSTVVNKEDWVALTIEVGLLYHAMTKLLSQKV